MQVPWFPRDFKDLDSTGKSALKGLEPGHPGFDDLEYKKRRIYIAELAKSYKMDDREIPRVYYNKDEQRVWKYCYSKL